MVETKLFRKESLIFGPRFLHWLLVLAGRQQPSVAIDGRSAADRGVIHADPAFQPVERPRHDPKHFPSGSNRSGRQGILQVFDPRPFLVHQMFPPDRKRL
jgi:hypothetical protein